MTHYLIYKITNNLNGKIYIGKHKTKKLDDGYMGSGKVIKQAIEKYGKENFTKEILFDVYGEDMMNFLEAAIVDAAFIAREDTYNIDLGGRGGGTFGNNSKRGQHDSKETRQKKSIAAKGKSKSVEHIRKNSEAHRGKHPSDETRKKMSESHQRYFANGGVGPNKGRCFSDETREKMSKGHIGKCFISEERKKRCSEANKGNKHALGRHWFNDGQTEVFLAECPEGFSKGRLKKTA